MALFGFGSKEKTGDAPEKERLEEGLEKTRTSFFGKLSLAVAGKDTVDAEVLDLLEEVLVASDVGGQDDRRSDPPYRGARGARQVRLDRRPQPPGP